MLSLSLSRSFVSLNLSPADTRQLRFATLVIAVPKLALPDAEDPYNMGHLPVLKLFLSANDRHGNTHPVLCKIRGVRPLSSLDFNSIIINEQACRLQEQHQPLVPATPRSDVLCHGFFFNDQLQQGHQPLSQVVANPADYEDFFGGEVLLQQLERGAMETDEESFDQLLEVSVLGLGLG